MEILKIFVDSFTTPLHDKIRPTLSELNNFLVKDMTNTTQYCDGNFVCTHFASALSLQARGHKYQMGVVWVYGHHPDTHEKFSHAFNVIYTTDGLCYVEPQNDKVWSYPDHAQIEAGKDYEFGFCDPPLRIHVDRIDIIVPP